MVNIEAQQRPQTNWQAVKDVYTPNGLGTFDNMHSPFFKSELISLRRRMRPDVFGSHNQLESESANQSVIKRAREIDILIKQRFQEADLKKDREKKLQGPQMLQYDGDLDWDEYEQIYLISDPQERQKKLDEQDKYIRRQLITHLGERLNVLLSRTIYEISPEGELLATKDISLLEMVKKGRELLKNPKIANPIDLPRQDAEVFEIEQVQNKLCGKATQVGSIMLAISPTGKRDLSFPEGMQDSSYLHNFYDIFTLKEKIVDGKRERYVEAKRYSSALSYEEYTHKLIEIKRDYFQHIQEEPMDLDEYFLSNPVLQQGKTPDEIHAFFHQDHEYLLEEDFNTIVAANSTDIERYIQILHAKPTQDLSPKELSEFNNSKKINQRSAFNLLLIHADEVKDQLLEQKKKHYYDFSYMDRQVIIDGFNMAAAALSMWQVRDQGKIENVRQAGGQCPGDSGMDTNSPISNPLKSLNRAPFSVRDAILNPLKKESGTCSCGGNTDNHYHCPSCDKKFADETERNQEERTKECSCGQKFGC